MDTEERLQRHWATARGHSSVVEHPTSVPEVLRSIPADGRDREMETERDTHIKTERPLDIERSVCLSALLFTALSTLNIFLCCFQV